MGLELLFDLQTKRVSLLCRKRRRDNLAISFPIGKYAYIRYIIIYHYPVFTYLGIPWFFLPDPFGPLLAYELLFLCILYRNSCDLQLTHFFCTFSTAQMGKITRVRTGCWTCKERRKKCDETKPICLNCTKSNKVCKGYGLKLIYDFESDNFNGFKNEVNGNVKYGFTGRPRTNRSNNSSKATSSSNNNGLKIIPMGIVKQEHLENLRHSTNTYGDGDQDHNHDNNHDDDDNVINNDKTNSLPYRSSTSTINKMHEPHNFKMIQVKDEPIQMVNTFTATFQNKFNNSTSTITEVPIPSEMDREFMLSASDNKGDNNTGTNNRDNNNNPSSVFSPYSEDKETAEENKMLNHFFQRLVPLIDVHPNSPWPDLALKYCDFELAKSCFLSLSYVHKMGYIDFASIIENPRTEDTSFFNPLSLDMKKSESNELLAKSAEYINNSLDYLVKFLQDYKLFEQLSDPNVNIVNFQPIVDQLNKELLSSKIFVILLLTFIQILYAILDGGRTALVRLFLKLFASIVENKDCREIISQIDQSESLIVLLSFFDIVITLISPDCRIPYSRPSWLSGKSSVISIEHRMGLPVELCECMYDLGYLRHHINLNNLTRDQVLQNYYEIQTKLNNYREFVCYKIQAPPLEVSGRNITNDEYLVMRLKTAQLWSLAITIKLLSVTKPTQDYLERIDMRVCEFLDVYLTMDPNSQQIGQMVWPLLEVGINCKTKRQRLMISDFVSNVFQVVKATNIKMILEVLEKCWDLDVSLEELFMGKEWFQSGIEFLPL